MNDPEPYSRTVHEPSGEPMERELTPLELAQAAQRQTNRVEAWADEQVEILSSRLDAVERASLMTSMAVIFVALAIVFDIVKKSRAGE